MLRRRDFIKLFTGTTVGWSFVARAQQTASLARIGWMSLGSAGGTDPFMDSFRKRMLDLDYVEGRNFHTRSGPCATMETSSSASIRARRFL
jgi:hypothetical protein